MRLHTVALSLLFAGLFPLIAAAQPPYAPPHVPGTGYGPPGAPPPQSAEQNTPGPAQIVSDGLDKLMGVIREVQQRRADPHALITRLREDIAPYFDFDYMADWAAGPYKRRMSPGQRQAFAHNLQEMFFTALAQQLADGQGYHYRMLPPRSHRRSGETVVSVQVLQHNRPLSRLDFRMYQSGGQWKVFDVMADNRSAIQYYRQYFNDQVAQQGLGVLLGR